MLTLIEREIAVTLAEALAEYGIGEHLFEYGCSGEVDNLYDWYDNNDLYQMGFRFSAGMTKVCITHRDLENWVIKVGFNRCLVQDYAKREYEVYRLAEQAGLEYYFPETIYLGDFFGVPFYAQKMAECQEDAISADWYERLAERYDCYGEEYTDSDIWDVIYDMDDREKAMLCFNDEDLADFLMENRIGDLHEGNFGYIGDRLVIVDFSGYRG
jgi:hypothetical protein